MILFRFQAACSAVFVQKLAHSATKIIVDNDTNNPISETNTNGRVVTSDHVRQVIKSDLDSYDFLFGHNKKSNIEANSDDSVLCNLKEERAPPLKKKRKKTNIPNRTKMQKSNQDDKNDKHDVDDMERKKNILNWIPTKQGDVGMLAENKIIQKTVVEAMSSHIPDEGLLEDTDEYD